MKNRVVIIGAGAAGLAAAVTLKKGDMPLSVTVLEKAAKAGKKILASGNGRCNLSNLNASPKYYNEPAFLEDFFKTYDYPYIEKFYKSLGLLITVRDGEGRAYPVSNSAVSVIDVYNAAVKKYGIEIVTDTEVTDLRSTAGTGGCAAGHAPPVPMCYLVRTADGKEYPCEYVIYAAGSPAGGTQGGGEHLCSNNTKFPAPLCSVPLRPSLCPLLGDKEELKHLENIRVKCLVKGLGHGEGGEVQFRKDSLSGIVIFNFAARLARKRLENAVLSLDLFPDTETEELYDFIVAQRRNADTAVAALSGLCVSGVAKNILTRLNIAFQFPISKLTDKQLYGIVNTLKNYQFKVYQNPDFKEAQAVSGGVALSEIGSVSFECKKHKGLYIVGEALDIDGECGGFNLHFATCSGIAAASHILNTNK